MGSMTEEEFLAMLSADKKGIYRKHELDPNLQKELEGVLTMREYNAFKNIKWPAYPSFMDRICNRDQINNFCTFVNQGKWGICDPWMQQYSQHDADYQRWKAKFIARNPQLANSTPSSPATPSPRARPVPQPAAVPDNLVLSFPTAAKTSMEGKKNIRINRIAKETKASLRITAGTGNQSQLIISSSNPAHIIAGCKEVMRTFSVHQKFAQCDYDSKLFQFVQTWSKEQTMLFQFRYKCSVMPLNKEKENSAMVMIKAWTNEEKKSASAKLKELQRLNKKPSDMLDSVDVLKQLMGALKEEDSINSLPECVNILILGETGVGKSTFLNAMANYLKFESLDEAERNGPEVILPAKFTYTDSQNTMHEVEVMPSGEENGTNSQNENMNVGASATQDPVSYLYVLPGKQPKHIRIIDTPGIGDTGGVEKDAENFEKIMSYIADFPEIHAILLLVKPDNTKLTTSFKYCIQELLGRLHKSASKNVIFGFTHAKGTFYRPGASYTLLKKLLGNLQATNGIEIPLSQETTYCFDSDSFQYLAGRSKEISYLNEEKERYKQSWNEARKETKRLFEYIYQLKPHNVNETLCINNTKKVIQTLAKPLAEVTKNLLLNQDLLQQKLVEIDQLKSKGAALKDQLYWDQVVLETEELSGPQTVCSSSSCVEYETIAGNAVAVPKSICDPNCRHTGVQPDTLSNSKLQTCKAFNNGKCTVCGCNWQTHMHIRYKVNKVLKKVINEEVQKHINSNSSEVDQVNIFIQNTQAQIKKLTDDKEKILKHSSEFALFVAESCLLAVNDAYCENLKMLIHEEKNRPNAGNDDKLLRKLEQYRDSYEEQTRLLKDASQSKKSGIPTRSVDEIHKMIEELKGLEICGSLLEEIQELEIVSVRSSEMYASKKVELTNWRRNLSWLVKPLTDLFSSLTI